MPARGKRRSSTLVKKEKLLETPLPVEEPEDSPEEVEVPEEKPSSCNETSDITGDNVMSDKENLNTTTYKSLQKKIDQVESLVLQTEDTSKPHSNVREMLEKLACPLFQIPLEKRHPWIQEAIGWIEEALAKLKKDKVVVLHQAEKEVQEQEKDILTLEKDNQDLAYKIVEINKTLHRRMTKREEFEVKEHQANQILYAKKATLTEKNKESQALKKEKEQKESDLKEFVKFAETHEIPNFWTKKYKQDIDQSLRDALDSVFAKKDEPHTQFDTTAIEVFTRQLQDGVTQSKKQYQISLDEVDQAAKACKGEEQAYAEYCSELVVTVKEKIVQAEADLAEQQKVKTDVERQVQEARIDLVKLKEKVSEQEKYLQRINSGIGAFRDLQYRTGELSGNSPSGKQRSVSPTAKSSLPAKKRGRGGSAAGTATADGTKDAEPRKRIKKETVAFWIHDVQNHTPYPEFFYDPTNEVGQEVAAEEEH